MKFFVILIVWCFALWMLTNVIANWMGYTIVPYSFPWFVMCFVNGYFAGKLAEYGEKKKS